MLRQELAIIALVLAIALVYVWTPVPGGSTAPDYSPSIWTTLAGHAKGTLLPGAASGTTDTSTRDMARTRVYLSANPTQSVWGQIVDVQAQVSDCPRANIHLSLDGQILSYDWLADGSGMVTQLRPSVGHHVLSFDASEAGCAASLGIDVLAAQCSDGQQQACDAGGCGGIQTCAGQLWGACVPLSRICRPGERVECSSTSCSFGLSQCNACGTGWLECRPPESYN